MKRLTRYDAVRGCYVIIPDNDQNHIQKLGQLEDRDEAKDVINIDLINQCPICHCEVDDDFCSECGQRLKW